MKKIKIEKVATERELQIILLELEKRWKNASEIKDTRKRFREIMRVRNDAKDLLSRSERIRRSANFDDNSSNLLSKIKKIFARWFSSMEKKYK